MDSLLDIYRLILAIGVVGMAIGTLEYWTIAREFRSDGVYPWPVLRLRIGPSILTRIAEFDDVKVRALLVVRGALLALILLLPLNSALFSIATVLLILSILVLRWRTGFDQDGSDGVNRIVLITVALCVGAHSTPVILKAGLWFIALQSCLSYSMSGIIKAMSPSWRRGEAIYRVMSTKTYGLGAVARLLRGRPKLQVVLAWSVILMESLFPLALVLPLPALWVFLAWAISFHLLSGITMGFNTFFWAFASTYPAVIFAASEIRISGGILQLLGG